MSTRGWYEFYVLDLDNSEMSLAMQFYKWGMLPRKMPLLSGAFFITKLKNTKVRFLSIQLMSCSRTNQALS